MRYWTRKRRLLVVPLTILPSVHFSERTTEKKERSCYLNTEEPEGSAHILPVKYCSSSEFYCLKKNKNKRRNNRSALRSWSYSSEMHERVLRLEFRRAYKSDGDVRATVYAHVVCCVRVAIFFLFLIVILCCLIFVCEREQCVFYCRYTMRISMDIGRLIYSACQMSVCVGGDDILQSTQRAAVFLFFSFRAPSAVINWRLCILSAV